MTIEEAHYASPPTAAPRQPPLSDPPPNADDSNRRHPEELGEALPVRVEMWSTESSPKTSQDAMNVRPGDLSAFLQLINRFQVRVERAAIGRKYRPLRNAFEEAAAEISKFDDKIHLHPVSEKVLEALRLGCESGKIVIVDACLDGIHRLFEYGHFGSATASTDIILDQRDGVLDEIVAMVCSCLEVKDEDVYLRMVQTLLTASTRTNTGLHQGTLLAAVRTIYNIYLNARMPGTITTARVSLTQILSLVFTRMESEAAHNVGEKKPLPKKPPPNYHVQEHVADVPQDVPTSSPSADEGGDSTAQFTSVLQKDAYLLFRALCKLSGKEDVDISGADPVGIRSKLLSLELLRSLVANSGPAFRSGERFIYALRQYLAPSLLVNCMWNSTDIMDVSFDILEMLLRKDTLRPLLKREIGALFDTVIFRFLESPTAGVMRKSRAVTFISRLSADRQTMADLFLNYDCDMESPNIFERLVNVISAAAQERTPRGSVQVAASTLGDGQISITALTSVVQIVRSLREWSKPVEDSKEGLDFSSEDSLAIEASSRLRAVDDKKKIDGVASPVSTSDDHHSENPDIEPPIPSLRASVSNLAIVGIISEGSDSDTARFEAALKAKQETAEGIALFNVKSKKGIEFLVSRGRLRREPKAVAAFIHKAENLDEVVLGEYLGEGDDFNIKVMYSFTDMMDFTNVSFDGALREHLEMFRLPGEAQKIERIMEKFASRYCECNPDLFANADTAFVLAYSLIMLHTDAHNDTIKQKMTKEGFLRNNRGINDGADLSPAFLGSLYDRITTTEIQLKGSKNDAKEKTILSTTAGSEMDSAQKARQFEEESRRLKSQTKALFKKNELPAQDYTYYTATNVHHARLMFDRTWFPVLAAISQNLEKSSPLDSSVVSFCLDGFRNCIAISSTFGMSTAIDAFVSSLAKFTHLNSISEMRPKNVECVRMILAIAALEGNNLGKQWIVIVRAISQLEQIRAVASGNYGKYHLQKSQSVNYRAEGQQHLVTGSVFERRAVKSQSAYPQSEERMLIDAGNVSTKSASASRSVGTDTKAQHIDPRTASMAATIAESEIERIFTNSSEMPASNVADFCSALCSVALQELREKPSPRTFCLQKIVEIAYYNMESRTRIQWGKIWAEMGPFFTDALCHENRDVAMYAIDSLRQLASKFLEKDELSNFSFQRAFLKPFEVCFNKSQNIQVRELVLQCISQIVLARAGNIKSGWKSVFTVLAFAAEDSVISLAQFGWQIVESIVRRYIGVFDDVYIDAVTGVAAYTKTKLSSQISLAAIELLSVRCAKSLADGTALSTLRKQPRTEQLSAKHDHDILFTAENVAHIGAWFPVLIGLASAIQDDRGPIRMAATEALHKVFSNYGGRFSSSLWALIFRGVIVPMFDDVRHLTTGNRAEAATIGEWVSVTGSPSLKALVDVFVKHIAVTRPLMKDLVGLIQNWILQDNEVVAREGIGVFARLVMISGKLLEDKDWKVVITAISDAFNKTMPREITGPNAGAHDGTDENGIREMHPEANGVEEHENIEGNGVKEQEISRDKSDTDGPYSSIRDSAQDGRKMNFRVVRAKCVVQLLLINLVQEIVVSFYRVLSTEHILELSKALETSYIFAHNFNIDVKLRCSLWRSGFMNQVPNLLNQETSSLMAYLRITFWLYLDPQRSQPESITEDIVLKTCEEVLKGYIKACEDAHAKSEERREVGALSPVVCFLVQRIMQMSIQQFEKMIPSFYYIFLDVLDAANDSEVRRCITKLLRAKTTAKCRKPSNLGSPSMSSTEAEKPQLPGMLRECLVHVEVHDDAGALAAQEICTALNRAGGVRSVGETDDGDNTFRVVALSPDEMLLYSVLALPFVRAAYVSESIENLDTTE